MKLHQIVKQKGVSVAKSIYKEIYNYCLWISFKNHHQLLLQADNICFISFKPADSALKIGRLISTNGINVIRVINIFSPFKKKNL